MGHLVSKEPRNRPSHKRPRCCSWCRRRRPLLRLRRRTPAKASPQPAAAARSRDCFFRGPCMLCFIVHSPGAPAPAGLEEEPPLSPPPPPPPPRDGAYASTSSTSASAASASSTSASSASAASQHLARRYAALAAEDCAAARRFLLSSAAVAAAAAAAAWEQQGPSLFLASVGPVRFLGPPAAVQLFRGPQPPPPPPPPPPPQAESPAALEMIFSNLSLDERCLSASLVCKYWRDLCLDFQFWKQLDLSSRQQVWS
ncbi:hypothetical protein NN561_014538 [Cricetulus griseus]